MDAMGVDAGGNRLDQEAGGAPPPNDAAAA